MTEPSAPRPVPGPPRSGGDPSPGAATVPPEVLPVEGTGSRFAALDALPVVEHVAAFEAEHDRLRRELGTIDQL